MSSAANHDAERAILGSIMLENDRYDEVAQIVAANDMALDSHRRIFRCMAAMLNANHPVDMITLSGELGQSGELEAVGGLSYLCSLTEGLPRQLNVSRYAEIIKESGRIRALSRMAERLTTATQDPTERSEDLIAMLDDELLSLHGMGTNHDTAIAHAIVPLLDRMQSEHQRDSELLGLSFGLTTADQVTRGLQDGEITILAAGSGVGKSVLMTQVIIANCSIGVPVLCFSLEMSGMQLLRRILSVISGVPFPRVRDPKWAHEDDMMALRNAAGKTADWPLRVVDDSSITIEKLAGMVRIAKRKHGVRLICVDYLQISIVDRTDCWARFTKNQLRRPKPTSRGAT